MAEGPLGYPLAASGPWIVPGVTRTDCRVAARHHAFLAPAGRGTPPAKTLDRDGRQGLKSSIDALRRRRVADSPRMPRNRSLSSPRPPSPVSWVGDGRRRSGGPSAKRFFGSSRSTKRSIRLASRANLGSAGAPCSITLERWSGNGCYARSDTAASGSCCRKTSPRVGRQNSWFWAFQKTRRPSRRWRAEGPNGSKTLHGTCIGLERRLGAPCMRWRKSGLCQSRMITIRGSSQRAPGVLLCARIENGVNGSRALGIGCRRLR